jgi:hypothetical protein
MLGGPCGVTADCEAGLECVDGFCAQNAAPAPVASSGGLLVIVGLLLVVGTAALIRRRSST